MNISLIIIIFIKFFRYLFIKFFNMDSNNSLLLWIKINNFIVILLKFCPQTILYIQDNYELLLCKETKEQLAMADEPQGGNIHWKGSSLIK